MTDQVENTGEDFSTAYRRTLKERDALRREVAIREATITIADGTYQGTRDVAAEYKVRMEQAEANLRAQTERANQLAEAFAEMSYYTERLTKLADYLGAKWEGDDDEGDWILPIPGTDRRTALPWFMRQYQDAVKRADGFALGVMKEKDGTVYRVLGRDAKVVEYHDGDVVEDRATRARGRVVGLEVYRRLAGENWIADPYWVPVLPEHTDEPKGWDAFRIQKVGAKSGDIIGLDGKPEGDPGDVYVVMTAEGPVTFKAGEYLLQDETSVPGQVCPHETWREHSGRDWVDVPDEIPVIEYRGEGRTGVVNSWKVGTFGIVGPEDLKVAAELYDDQDATDKEPG